MTSQTHQPVDETADPAEPAPAERPIQLELDGIGATHPLLAAGYIDPRFILSDETCRRGRKHIAEMRRILTASAERTAA